jgi:phage baseplate assembly protein gpV
MRDTQLVLPRVPIATGVLGAAAIPAVDDLVVVLFLNGDYHAPIVVGRLYHADEPPPKHSAGQVVLALPPGQSKPDLTLVVDGSAPTVELKLPGDVDLKAEDSQITLSVGQSGSSSNGGLSLTLDGSGSGQIQIAAGQSTITINQKGDIAINASGDLKLQGVNIDIEASGQVTIQGATVGVN